MSDCGGAYNEVMKLITAIEELTSPWELVVDVGKSILLNHKEIFAHVEGAITDWNSQSYEEFGKNIGEIIAILVNPSDVEYYDIYVLY